MKLNDYLKNEQENPFDRIEEGEGFTSIFHTICQFVGAPQKEQ